MVRILKNTVAIVCAVLIASNANAAISVVGQSDVLVIMTRDQQGLGPLTFPPNVQPGDFLVAYDFVGGYSALRKGWFTTDTVPGPGPDTSPGSVDNQWSIPPETQLGYRAYNGTSPPELWSVGATWRPVKVYSGRETASSRPAERKEVRGWEATNNTQNSSNPYFGWAGVWVSGALRGVNTTTPFYWSSYNASSINPTLITVNGVQGYRVTFQVSSAGSGGQTVPGAHGKRGLWWFACEWGGAQEILNHLRPYTWGAFDGQVTYQTVFFGSSYVPGATTFHDTPEDGRDFSHATGLAVITSPLPSDTIPDATWIIRSVNSVGTINTSIGGPFGAFYILNDAPISSAVQSADSNYVTVTGNIGAGSSVTVTNNGISVTNVTYPDVATYTAVIPLSQTGTNNISVVSDTSESTNLVYNSSTDVITKSVNIVF
jgi:hypothetical protein